MTNPIISDEELVRKYLEGNEDCLRMIINRHQTKLFTYIYFLVRDKYLAEDIFQDTFVKVINTLKSHKYQEEGKFYQWVVRIARNLVIDHFRKTKKMPVITDSAGKDLLSHLKIPLSSSDCVDVYNPKVIQASMGALLHVSVFYYDLKSLLATAAEANIPVYGTLLEGESIYNHKLGNIGIILLGNESKGISASLSSLITNAIMIPKFSTSKPGMDSLNVGMAASIIFSEFLRKSISIPEL